MRILWLCNMVPTMIRSALGIGAGSGLWLDHVLSDLLHQEDITLRVLCQGGEQRGTLENGVQYRLFPGRPPACEDPRMEAGFEAELTGFVPDVIHIWGTEYPHALAMVNACRRLGFESRTVVSIQGLSGLCGRHYNEGVPASVRYGFTLRDLLRWNNPYFQARQFSRQGILERRALEGVSHILGRTDWDRTFTGQINPRAQYHFCNETLREEFYTGCWRYDGCQKHRIFASSCVFPLKGFHYLLEAFAQVVKQYPDATLAVPGTSFLSTGLSDRLRRQTYHAYLGRLARKYGLAGKIEFLGDLSAGEMKRAYLGANVFVLPSTIENSPNSLGEAMLLGVPSVAADVGGVSSLMEHGREGFLYPSAEPGMLAGYICRVFSMEGEAEKLGQMASRRAWQTHDPETNLNALLAVYRLLAQGGA